MDAKRKIGREEALAMARAARRLVVVRGTKVERHDPAALDDDALAERVLGRSGTLRAPAMRSGATMFVGFPRGGFEELSLR